MSSPIKQNTEILQNLLNTINNLPEAGGVDLPELTNPASPSEVFKNKEVIDSEGNKVTGTFTIDNELSTQDTLISQIQAALENKAAMPDAGGGGSDTRFKDYFEGTLTEIVDSTITKLKANAFRSAGDVTIVDLPNCTSVGGSAFRECTMTTLNMPELTGTAGTYFCYNCSNLENVNAPKLTTLSNSSFRLCVKLKKLELDNPTTIASSAFQGSSSLDTLIIRKTGSTCSLSATNAFTDTAIANGTGYIYVPASLVDSYKSATNWSSYANQIRAIEDYPEICGA